MERRRFPRRRIKVIVDYLSRMDFLVCYINDISGCGMFAETTEPLPLGEVIYLDFYLPGFYHKFKLKGRVVRIVTPEDAEKNGLIPGMGIDFIDPPQHIQKQIDEFVRKDRKE